MPEENNHSTNQNKNAFLGLQSYTEAQANSFFGRDNEIDAVTSLIHLNTLTIIFGRSGTGKTSLLNAGVFPKLRKKYCLPFKIRLEFGKNSPDFVTQTKQVLKQEIDKYGFNVESYPSSETLWEYFHKEPLWRTVTPILVFDQFEEIFTLAKSNPRWSNEMPGFWEELSDLIENNIPKKLEPLFLNQKEKITYNYKTQKTKIVFAFREEYLPEFETVTAKIPSIKYSRFRLMPMNGNQAYDVITKTWQDEIKPTEAKKIISYLINDPEHESYDLITVEPSLLSQVCAFIDKERIASGGGRVSADLLKTFEKETILSSIYADALMSGENALPVKENENADANRLKVFIEDKLITTDGYRIKYALSDSDTPLLPGINVLVNKYFLRENDSTVELTHDVLTPIIKSQREERLKDVEAKELKEKTKKRIKQIVTYLLLVGAVAFIAITASAFLEKQRLEGRADDIKKQIIRDSIYLAGLKGKVDTITEYIKSHPIPPVSNTNDENVESLLKKLNGISPDFASFHLHNENDIKQLKDSISRFPGIPLDIFNANLILRNQVRDLTLSNERLKKSFDSLYIAYTNIERALNEIKTRYETLILTVNDLRNQNNRLNEINNGLDKDNKALRAEIARLYRECNCPTPNPPKPTPSNPDTANCLKLQLSYTNSKNYYPSLLPNKLKIYLIPYASENLSLIRKASSYEQIDEAILDRSEGRIIGQYSEPYFIFRGLKPGEKYLIKICTLYGNYETFTKKPTGCDMITLDAVPAIKDKDR